jgi:hypothetical protein
MIPKLLTKSKADRLPSQLAIVEIGVEYDSSSGRSIANSLPSEAATRVDAELLCAGTPQSRIRYVSSDAVPGGNYSG